MDTMTSEARAAIAREWTRSSLSQEAFAARHGIRPSAHPRTLREWVRRFGTGRRPHAQLRAAIVASIEQLQNVLAALDTEVAADLAAAHEAGQEVAERHAAAETSVTPPRATPVSPLAEPLASSTTTPLGAERAAGARRTAAVRDSEAAVNVPDVAGPVLAAPATVAVMNGAGGTPAPACPAGRAVGQSDRGGCQGDTAADVLDFESLRQRAAQLRAARAARGGAEKEPVPRLGRGVGRLESATLGPMNNRLTIYISTDGTTRGVTVHVPAMKKVWYVADAQRALAEVAQRLGVGVQDLDVRDGPPPAGSM
jgi:hypothetical protein